MATKPSKRLALVIGNQSYDAFPVLSNTLKDAKDIQAKLLSLGFDVSYESEQMRRDMVASISMFAEKLRDPSYNTTDIVFYYAGHGCNIRKDLLSLSVLARLFCVFHFGSSS